MDKIIFYLKIFTNGNNLEIFFSENLDNNIINLGKEILVYKESSDVNQLKMQIKINKDETKSYYDYLRFFFMNNLRFLNNISYIKIVFKENTQLFIF